MPSGWKVKAVRAISSIIVLVGLGPRSALCQELAGSVDTLFVSLSDAKRIALEQNPVVLGESQVVEQAAGGLRTAHTYPLNPEAEVELAGAPDGDGLEGYELRLVQGVEWAGQGGLRVGAAEAGLASAEAGLANVRRRTTYAVSVAFYRSWAADRRLELASEILTSNERLGEAVRTQVQEGEVSVMDANFAEIEVARSRARVLAARREATSTELALAQLLGVSPDTLVRPSGDPDPDLPAPAALDLGALTDAAMGRRPDLIASEYRVTQAQTLARLAGRDALPELGVGALVQGGEAELPTRIGLLLSLPVPLWNRNQGLSAKRGAEARQVAVERDATVLDIRAEVTEAYRAYVAATEEEGVFEDQLLTATRQNQELLEVAYGEGEIDLPSLVLLRNQLLDAELGYWDAWLARRLSFSALDAATGGLE